MDNLFVVVDRYDHYCFKESKVTRGNDECFANALHGVTFRLTLPDCSGGDAEGVAGAGFHTPLDKCSRGLEAKPLGQKEERLPERWQWC